MKLLIVESPSKARTIEKYLGEDFAVRASVGHIRDLPKSNKDAIDVEAGFVPRYEVSKGKEKVVAELYELAEQADSIMLATDPDREGEAIAWHIDTLLRQDKKVKAPIKRVTFNEITKEAVQEAIKHPRAIDTDLRRAQEARRVLDRLVGYDLSGIIWKKVRYGLSAGRVQSPALRIIMEREREIKAFIPEKYWKIWGDFQNTSKAKLTLNCEEEPRDEKLVDEILKEGKKGSWVIDGVKESKQKRSPRAPFTTSTLQQRASSLLGYSPSRTMQLAQKLYEAGHITYMRTDSTSLAASAQKQIISYVKKTYGDDYVEARAYKTKSKNAQEAHEAIRPTKISVLHAGTMEQQKLYQLIWERTVASQMAPADLLKTKITAKIEGKEKLPAFSANGSRLIFPGWLEVDKRARGEDVELPKCSEGEKLNLLDIQSEENFTQPPSRYTEAGLVKELEKRGIGRPSTYASIMRTLESRKYVNKEGKTLFPTDTGEVVSDFLEKNFPTYIGDTFTAEMEDELDDIAAGKREYEKTLKDFYGPFTKEIKDKEKLAKATDLGDAPEHIKCPKCESKMIIKLSRAGKFYSCSRYPDCEGALRLDGTEIEGPKETGKMCPKCGNPAKNAKHEPGKLVIRERHDGTGTFVSCSRYPKCKYIEEDEEDKKRKMTGVKCPECANGEMMEKRGRFGVFYACSEYPKCKYAIKAKPTGKKCHMCNSLMMEGTKTIPERCSDKKCPNHRPDKLAKESKK